MDKRKRSDHAHWITPGVFSGKFQVQEAVGQLSYAKKPEVSECPDEIVSPQDKVEVLEKQVKSLQQEVEEWKKQLQSLNKERDLLYQAVLSIKREWEVYRHEDSHR